MNQQYTFAVTTPFTGSINQTPWMRSQIESAFTELDWTAREPYINAVDLRSSSAFHVALNEGVSVDAVQVGSQYIVQYEGSIAYLIFSANTTLQYFWCDWWVDHQNHKVPTFTALSGTTITLANDYGISIPACGTNQFELSAGWYTLAATKTGYVTVTQRFLYQMESSVVVFVQTAS